MNRSQPSALGLSLTIVRAINGWTQTALAKASGTGSSQLSQYENGKIRLTQERFDALVAAMRTADGVGELTTSMVALLLSMAGGDAEAPADDLTAEEQQAVHASVLRMLRSLGEVLHQGAVAQVRCRPLRQHPHPPRHGPASFRRRRPRPQRPGPRPRPGPRRRPARKNDGVHERLHPPPRTRPPRPEALSGAKRLARPPRPDRARAARRVAIGAIVEVPALPVQSPHRLGCSAIMAGSFKLYSAGR